MATFANIDPATSFASQLEEEEGPIVLMDTVIVPNKEHDNVLALWTKDSYLMKSQPGFISAQLHKGIANSNLILNIAVWESTTALRNAYNRPEFQETLKYYPEGTVVYQHIAKRTSVPNICIA